MLYIDVKDIFFPSSVYFQATLKDKPIMFLTH